MRSSSSASLNCRPSGRRGSSGGELGRVSRKPRPQLRARAAIAQLPRRTRAGTLRFAPSARSVVIGLALAALGALGYLGARETSVFAVRTIQVVGVSPALATSVRAALQPLEGQSLLKLHGDDVSRLATALPGVEAVSYDRAFPNTLRVRVEPEQPLAVLRRGAEWWLLSRRGRVMSRLVPGRRLGMPRIWLTKKVNIALGGMLGAGGGAEEAAALVPLRSAGLSARVSTVRIAGGQIVYVLRGGLELRVGTADNLALKLAVARRILVRTNLVGYLDVSVPERPVAGTNPQVSG